MRSKETNQFKSQLMIELKNISFESPDKNDGVCYRAAAGKAVGAEQPFAETLLDHISTNSTLLYNAMDAAGCVKHTGFGVFYGSDLRPTGSGEN